MKNKRVGEKKMKKYRVVMLVVFMLVISLFAFVTQGEELVLVNEIEKGTLAIEVNKIRLETKIKEADKEATKRHEQALFNQKIEALEFNEAEKLNQYFEDKQFAYESSMDGRVDEVMKLTPLDAKTARIVLDYSDKYNIRPAFILGVMDLESTFNQYLVGTSQDRGYMQIIPGTEKWLATAYGEELGLTFNPDRIFEANYNIPLSVKYFDVLRQEFNNNETKMLTAYNRGNYGLQKWYDEHGTYETAYSRVVLKRAKKYVTVK